MSRTKPKPKIKTIPWDPAANLKTDADIAHYLEAVFERFGGCGFRRRRPCQGHVTNRAGGGPWAGEPV
jgi:hypothetical protein